MSERSLASIDPARFLEDLRSRRTAVAVIGLGYVGLPLAVEFARAGFDVTGFDVDASKVADINAGRSYILDVQTEDVAACVKAGRMRATTDMSRLGDMDAVDICVPTPLRKTRDPDMSYVVAAAEEIAKYIHDNFYTVPIGHPDFNFALSDKLDWKPRLDGFILLKEMKFKS